MYQALFLNNFKNSLLLVIKLTHKLFLKIKNLKKLKKLDMYFKKKIFELSKQTKSNKEHCVKKKKYFKKITLFE